MRQALVVRQQPGALIPVEVERDPAYFGPRATYGQRQRQVWWPVRYIITPLVLLPIVWPWFVIKAVHVWMVVVTMAARTFINFLIALAEILRHNQHPINKLGLLLEKCIGWACFQYWLGLSHLHSACEDVLQQMAEFWAPLASNVSRAMQQRWAPVQRICQVGAPLTSTWQRIVDGAESAYIVAHDEIVPVALDMAARIPFLEELLLRCFES